MSTPTFAGRPGFDLWETVEGLREALHSNRPTPRMGRGDVRTAILVSLAEEPMHGYQIIQAIETRSNGAWKPSPGSVYPTLQLLADDGSTVIGQSLDNGTTDPSVAHTGDHCYFSVKSFRHVGSVGNKELARTTPSRESPRGDEIGPILWPFGITKSELSGVSDGEVPTNSRTFCRFRNSHRENREDQGEVSPDSRNLY